MWVVEISSFNVNIRIIFSTKKIIYERNFVINAREREREREREGETYIGKLVKHVRQACKIIYRNKFINNKLSYIHKRTN